MITSKRRRGRPERTTKIDALQPVVKLIKLSTDDVRDIQAYLKEQNKSIKIDPDDLPSDDDGDSDPEYSIQVKLEEKDLDSDLEIDSSWEKDSDEENVYFKHTVKVEVLDEDNESLKAEGSQTQRKSAKANIPKVDWTCALCKRKFKSRNGLHRHIKTHLEDMDKVNVKCPLCESRFEKRSFLVAHLILVHQKKKMCPLCGIMTRCVASHMARLHSSSADDFPFACDKCDKRFVDKHQFKTHQLYHSKSKPFKCARCPKTFHHKLDCDKHQAVHSRKQIQCSQCPKKFKSEYLLSKHEKFHETSRSAEETTITTTAILKCLFCPEHPEFEEYELLKDHVFAEHVPEVPANPKSTAVDCNLCGDTFENGLALFDHLFEGHLKGELHCAKCSFKQSLPSLLETHLKLIHNLRKKMCAVCGKRIAKLKDHMARHYPEHMLKYPCTECDRRCLTPGELRLHLTSHSDARPFKCPHCKMSFRLVYGLNDHLRSHSATRELFDCPDCGIKYTSKKVLKTHMEIHERAPTGYIDSTGRLKCPLCDDQRDFANYNTLKDHVLEKHDDEHKEKITCPLCEESFEKAVHLLDHIFVEHITYLPACDFCDYKSAIPGVMRNHMLVVHKGVSRRCVICGLAVRSMKKHKFQHVPESSKLKSAKFKCSDCDKVFYDASRMRAHAIKHAKEEFECKECGKRFRSESYLNSHVVVHLHKRLPAELVKVKENLTCPLCATDFRKDYDKFKDHVLQKHGQGEDNKCRLCPRTVFKNALGLLDHMFIRHLTSVELFCGICEDISAAPGQMELHLRSAHNMDRQMCFICGDRVRYLTAHIKCHDKNSELTRKKRKAGKAERIAALKKSKRR